METKLYTVLSGSTLITATVSTRIYPAIVPQGVTFPAVTFFRLSGGQVNSLRGYEALENPLIQIDCWGTGYKGVKDLALNVHKVMNSAAAFSALLQNDRDMTELTADGELIYRVSMDFTCMNQTTHITP